MTTAKTLTLGAAGLMALAASALAQGQPAAGPTLLTESRDWKAFAAQTTPKSCYAISAPQKMEPPTLNHGTVFFFVTTRPSEKIRNEPSIQVGYSFKENTKVGIDVDGKKFELFTKGDGAWLETPAAEAQLIDAMKRGKQLTVTGTSGRGNTTTYAFSLAGISGAIDAVAKECK